MDHIGGEEKSLNKIYGVRSKRSKVAHLTCEDCDFEKHERDGDDNHTTTAAARYHAGKFNHTVKLVRSWTSVYSMCDTINEDHETGPSEEKDLPSDSGSSERNDVAFVGGVRQDAAVVRWRADREGTCVPAEEKYPNETDVRGPFPISGPFVERSTRHADNKRES